MNSRRFIAAASVIIMLALVTSIAARSQASGANPNKTQQGGILDVIERNKQAQELTGSWELDIVSTPGPGAPPPLKALVTFAEGGGCVETILLPPVVPAHGEWRKIGDKQYEFAVVHPLFDSVGNPTATVRAKSKITLLNKNEFTATFTGNLFAPNGNLIAPISGTEQGRRISLESF
jgi:hypothetical protein